MIKTIDGGWVRRREGLSWPPGEALTTFSTASRCRSLGVGKERAARD